MDQPELQRLQDAIRKHRDQRGDDRCWEDDLELYENLPEGLNGADLRLMPVEDMLKQCEKYCKNRHNPAEPYVSPQREIERLQSIIDTLNADASNDYTRGYQEGYQADFKTQKKNGRN